MGQRGHTVHVLDAKAGDRLAQIGQRVAVLGRSRRWTTFVPIDVSAFDGGHASKILACPVVHVWFDDDAGASVQVYASGGFVGELALPSEDGDVSEADHAFVERLEVLGILSRVQRAALMKRMSDAAKLREWTMEHGLEKLLELPFYDPVPAALPERELLEQLPQAVTVLEAKKKESRSGRAKAKGRRPNATAAGAAAAAASKPMPPPKESWSEEERATLDLHREYWAAVFSMNNWKLYNRYKKHLPADQRRDVDQLCSAVALGDDDQLYRLVEGILARIWPFEDWAAVIRDPALVDGEPDAWAKWRARVAS